ncbi:MAG: hypothetical protein GWP19_14425 [Planctomycetia bacterium]|nr:hypothetical protein [Planctomycetia bacterium]
MNTTNSSYNYLINRIIDGSYNRQDLKLFINLCTSISAAYLKNEIYYNRIYFPIVHQDDSDLKDISLDLIAPLFARDETGSFKFFKRNLRLIYDQLTEELLYNRLKSIIISKTRQELIERFKEEEPGGYKILRNIKLAPTRSNNIKKFNIQFNTYYYYFEGDCQEPVIDHLNAELPEIEQNELLEIVRIICKKDTAIPKILECILLNVQKNVTTRNFIEVSSLFKALKNVLLYKTVPIDSTLEYNGYSNNHNRDNYNSKIFQELYESIILAVQDKYIDSGKINENVASYYRSILKEYFNDIIFANHNNTLPHYMNNGHSKLIKQEHLAMHKTRIEYLVKICKKKLGQIISKY